ncbi:hypothetical protein AA12717_0956 [Gluconacetobacter sacchari DSM 12717]|uniref:Uncharacterized protein n=1 Tax=Gluconacetobacter sacchari DSM 12717 TaxID=1307940 RepID=A0ABQ0P4N3_9PROT|nr:hypothetical protein AA12717_0956 [Gluconacetobacter sacchari DSM 12717]
MTHGLISERTYIARSPSLKIGCPLIRDGHTLLPHRSRLGGGQHINLTGDYLWTDAGIPEGKLRPLR